jgi:hypothetical protein
VTLEAVIRFKEYELAAAVNWVGGCDYALAPSVAIVESCSKASRDLVVGAEICLTSAEMGAEWEQE